MLFIAKFGPHMKMLCLMNTILNDVQVAWMFGIGLLMTVYNLFLVYVEEGGVVL